MGYTGLPRFLCYIVREIKALVMQELARASFQNHLFYFRTISQGTRKSNLKKKILQIFIKSVLGNDRLVFKVYDNLNLDA